MTETNRMVVRPGKSLTAAKAKEIKKKLTKVTEQKIKNVVLDFDKVETIDTVGLGIILAAHNTMKNIEGRLELINVSEEFSTFLKTMRLDQHFIIQTA